MQSLVFKQKSKQQQKLVLFTLQKQLSILRLKEYLVLIGFTIGAAGLRAVMQEFPSVEPITFFAILAGWLFGKNKGFLVGSSSLYVSNFLVFGGQGPWTPFQMAAFGIAGYLGGFLNEKAGVGKTLLVVFASTIIFEVIMNFSSSFFLGGNIMLAFLMGLPFLAIHLTSNLLFGLFLPKAKKIVMKKGGFNERKFIADVIAHISKSVGLSKTGKSGKSSSGPVRD